jgi:hypothetical protein
MQNADVQLAARIALGFFQGEQPMAAPITVRPPHSAHISRNLSVESISLTWKSAAARRANSSAFTPPSIPFTSLCVARICNPGECMLTKVIWTRSAPARLGFSLRNASAVS